MDTQRLIEPGTVAIRLAGDVVIQSRIETLGGATLGGQRAKIALARLAMEAGSTVPRDILADAIWADRPPPSWVPALRNVIAAVRRWLETAEFLGLVALDSAGEGYRLSLPTGSTVDLVLVTSDTRRAEQAAREGDHAAALRIAEQALLTASLPVLAGAEGEWVDGVRSQLEASRLRLDRVSGEAALALGDAARAEQVARRLIAAAPLREDAHRLLMRSLYAAGNRGEALTAYDTCRRMLADELGAMPSAPTEALFLEILAETQSERAALGPVRTTATTAGPLLLVQRQTPFVGRTELLDLLVSRLGVAVDAGPLLVVVSGEPGLGKTRLAAEVAASANAAGVNVLYGRADDRIALPYGSVLEALDTGLAALGSGEAAQRLGDHRGVLGPLLPSLAEAHERSEPTGIHDLDRSRVQQAILAALRLVANPRGALLVLDDMQWASRLELGVVEAIVRESSCLPLLVLVLARGAGDEACLEALGYHPRIERLALEPLTLDEITELARVNRAPAADLEEIASGVWRMSGGNPLLASELLRSWQPDGEHQRPVRIEELVRERLAELPARAQEVLRAAAVAGHEFDPRIVAAASAADLGEGLAALDSARRAGLLVAATRDPGWLAFRHALVRSSLLELLAPEIRLRIHQRLGSVLEIEAEPDRGAVVSLAYHFGAAAPLGEWRRAVRYALPVARAAYDAGVYEDVITVTSRTLQALADAADPDPGARLALEILLGGAQRALGETRGYDTLRDAFAAARAQGDPLRMADAALAFSEAGAASEELMVDDGLLDLYEEAIAALGATDLDRRAALLGHLAGAYAWRRSGAESRRAADEALALARELGEDATVARVLTTARRSLSGTVQLGQQLRLEDELFGLAERLDDPGQWVRTSLWRFDTSVERGHGDQLERLLETAAENARGLRAGNYHHSLTYAQAALALLRGRRANADVLVERAAAVGRERGLDATVVEAIRLIQLIGVRHEQHRLHDLRDEAGAFFGNAGVPEWMGALAFIDGELGRLETVGSGVDALLDGFEAGGARTVSPVGFVAHMAAPIARLDDPMRAARAYELILPFTGQGAYFAYFAGPMDYHLGLLARTANREQDAREHLADAVAFCQRLGAPRWQARCEAALSAPVAAMADRGPRSSAIPAA
jgi:DNA-binding SARP family transcriptional activator